MGIQLQPTRIKGSHYLLIPKDLAQLLEINDKSTLILTIDDTNGERKLVYSIGQPNGVPKNQAKPTTSTS